MCVSAICVPVYVGITERPGESEAGWWLCSGLASVCNLVSVSVKARVYV